MPIAGQFLSLILPPLLTELGLNQTPASPSLQLLAQPAGSSDPLLTPLFSLPGLARQVTHTQATYSACHRAAPLLIFLHSLNLQKISWRLHMVAPTMTKPLGLNACETSYLFSSLTFTLDSKVLPVSLTMLVKNVKSTDELLGLMYCDHSCWHLEATDCVAQSQKNVYTAFYSPLVLLVYYLSGGINVILLVILFILASLTPFLGYLSHFLKVFLKYSFIRLGQSFFFPVNVMYTYMTICKFCKRYCMSWQYV